MTLLKGYASFRHTHTQLLKRTCTLVCTCGGLNVYFMEVEVVSKIVERNSIKLLLKCFRDNETSGTIYLTS